MRVMSDDTNRILTNYKNLCFLYLEREPKMKINQSIKENMNNPLACKS